MTFIIGLALLALAVPLVGVPRNDELLPSDWRSMLADFGRCVFPWVTILRALSYRFSGGDDAAMAQSASYLVVGRS